MLMLVLITKITNSKCKEVMICLISHLVRERVTKCVVARVQRLQVWKLVDSLQVRGAE